MTLFGTKLAKLAGFHSKGEEDAHYLIHRSEIRSNYTPTKLSSSLWQNSDIFHLYKKWYTVISINCPYEQNMKAPQQKALHTVWKRTKTPFLGHFQLSRFRNCKDGTVLRNSAGYFHASRALHTRYTTAQAQNRDHENAIISMIKLV